MSEERMDVLERRVRDLESEIAEIRGERARATPARTVPAPAPAPIPTPAPAAPGPMITGTHSAPPAWVPAAEPRVRLTLEDVLSPRNLAVAGAIAVLIGLVFLVSYGISNGWISESLRVTGAAIFSLCLVGAGAFIQERRRAGAPPQALAVAGTGGLFLALVAATRLYDLIDPTIALVLSGLLGIFGVLLGMRWRNEVVAGAIVATSLVSPLLLEVTYDVGLLSFLIPVFMVAVAAAIHKPWSNTFTLTAALFLGSLIACVIDAEGGSTIAAFGLATLTLLLCAAGSVGHLLRNPEAAEHTQPVTYGVFVAAATALGMFLVSGSDGLEISDWGAAWFTVSAAIGGAVWWIALVRDRQALSITAFSLASASIAVALGFLFEDGPLLSAAWSTQAACLIAFGRTGWQRWVGYAALCLAAIVVGIEVPFELLLNGSEELAKDLAITAPLLLPLIAMAWRPDGLERQWGAAGAVTVCAYMGLLTSGALVSPESVVNLVPLALAAGLPMVLTRGDWTKVLFLIFGGAAIIFILLTAIPPDALIDGVPSVLDAAISCLILAAVLAVAHLRGPDEWRQPALWSALGLVLYIISALIVDGFQGTAQTEGGLPGTAQGQVIVSSLWALCGLTLIVAGLRRHRPNWRKAGLVLLVLSLVKITLYDLSSLSSAGRMISFILVGLALLAAALAYQWMSRQESDPA
ncbi:MAG TPA: DUF2339 domain-containing protein [Solirubrobacterales bacterium]|nr:DUF2339 domain-containing protein [Solirubrobacterales bacterium]